MYITKDIGVICHKGVCEQTRRKLWFESAISRTNSTDGGDFWVQSAKNVNIRFRIVFISLLDTNVGFPKDWSTPPFLLRLLSLPRQNVLLMAPSKFMFWKCRQKLQPVCWDCSYAWIVDICDSDLLLLHSLHEQSACIQSFGARRLCFEISDGAFRPCTRGREAEKERCPFVQGDCETPPSGWTRQTAAVPRQQEKEQHDHGQVPWRLQTYV